MNRVLKAKVPRAGRQAGGLALCTRYPLGTRPLGSRSVRGPRRALATAGGTGRFSRPVGGRPGPVLRDSGGPEGSREEWTVAGGRAVTGPGRPGRERKSAVDEQARVGLRSYLGYLVVTFILAALLVWSYTTATRLGYRLDELKTELASLRAVNEKLAFELGTCQSMARIEAEATGRLGMVRPEYVRVPVVPAGGGSGNAPGQGFPTSRVIHLAPDGAVRASGSEAVAALREPPPSPLGTLWRSFVRWLTGSSQAEAHGVQ
ncbi:MAG: cell division protein FtsL [Firmicutes bacterium]|nr:cell division protein FtsL [Bacillota bacterium]